MNWGWNGAANSWFTDFAASSLSNYQYDKKMIMRNFPFLLFALALFVSCTEEEPSAAEFIDLTVILDVTNSKGQNVFDPTSENFIDPNGIRLYYKENDNYKLYYQENRDAPYGFDISTIEEPSWMSLWAEEL
jgi:hypothetical protein